MVASSETIIIRTDEHNAANHVEDGQFTTFLPLTDEQEKDITDKGVILERMYSLDIKAEDGSTLRVMKNRRNIDLVELISGEYPSKDNEAVVERRYAEEHSLDVGSKLTVGGIHPLRRHGAPCGRSCRGLDRRGRRGRFFRTELFRRGGQRLWRRPVGRRGRLRLPQRLWRGLLPDGLQPGLGGHGPQRGVGCAERRKPL